MRPYWWTTKELAPTHSQGYNIVFSDGHVLLVPQRDLLYPPTSAPNWNRDNQPHADLWAPKDRWVVQE